MCWVTLCWMSGETDENRYNWNCNDKLRKYTKMDLATIIVFHSATNEIMYIWYAIQTKCVVCLFMRSIYSMYIYTETLFLHWSECASIIELCYVHTTFLISSKVDNLLRLCFIYHCGSLLKSSFYFHIIHLFAVVFSFSYYTFCICIFIFIFMFVCPFILYTFTCISY